jgi:hypothetical protein
MRLPFKLDESNLNEDARVKFIYTTSELHQNIEISLDAENTSVDSLLDAFERFLSALGISIPGNVMLQFVRVDAENEEAEDGEGGEEDEEDDEDEEKDF